MPLPLPALGALTRPYGAMPQWLRISFKIEGFGLGRMREPRVKHLGGPPWEMRMRARNGISRALRAAACRKRVVIVRTCVKKTQTTSGQH
jgi:phage-related protein